MYDPKEVVANYALQLVPNRNIIGLGTGRTVRKLVEALARNGLLESKTFVTSSIDTELLVSSYRGKVLSLFNGVRPEIYVDSFDVVYPQGDSYVMIKGGGGALLREKLLSFFSGHRVFIGESSKLKTSPPFKVPVEVVPVSVSYVMGRVREKYDVLVREGEGKIGPVISDNGNIILDLVLTRAEDLCKLDEELKRIPGVVETGIFCSHLYDEIVLGSPDGRLEVFKKS
ncbi:MAG: ribose 5-phosphate isomerase A [Candidatus Aramenus sp.]|nr:ribose 5-phosphate isomerase A [Candidatus Aramenus sp.]